MKQGKVVLGLLAGLAAGAVLGILLAPEKGSVTRKKITDKGQDYVDEVKNKFGNMVDGITEKYEKVKNQAEDALAKGKSKYDEAKKEMSNGAI